MMQSPSPQLDALLSESTPVDNQMLGVRFEQQPLTSAQQDALIMELEPAEMALPSRPQPLARDAAFLREIVSLAWAAEHAHIKQPVGSLPPAELNAAMDVAQHTQQSDPVERLAENARFIETLPQPQLVDPSKRLLDAAFDELPVDAASALPAVPRQQDHAELAGLTLFGLPQAVSAPLTSSATQLKYLQRLKQLADAPATEVPDAFTADAGVQTVKMPSVEHSAADELPAVSLTVGVAGVAAFQGIPAGIEGLPAAADPQAETEDHREPRSHLFGGEMRRRLCPETIPIVSTQPPGPTCRTTS